MIKIGTSRPEAIDWVQQNLGPITPRNIAENTYNALKKEGLIEWDNQNYEFYLLEDLNQDDLRRRARNTMIVNDQRQIQRKGPRSGCNNVHHSHSDLMHIARDFENRGAADSSSDDSDDCDDKDNNN